MSNGISLFDLHCDTVTACFELGAGLRENSAHISLDRGLRYDRWCQVFAVWIPDNVRGTAAQMYFKSRAEYLRKQAEINRGLINLCGSFEELDEACAERRCGAILSIEGGAALGGDMDKLREYYDMGVRIVTLTWNGKNEIGCGSVEDDNSGLTAFGKKLVKNMNDMGMIIDVSHLNEAGFFDVAELSERPFIASHSNFWDVCGHKRNLTALQADTIKERGGIIGLNLYGAFLDGGAGGIDSCYRHISYAAERGLEYNLALGCDFDGADIAGELAGIERLESLYEYLLSRGVSQSFVDRIFFHNAYEFFRANM